MLGFFLGRPRAPSPGVVLAHVEKVLFVKGLVVGQGEESFSWVEESFSWVASTIRGKPGGLAPREFCLISVTRTWRSPPLGPLYLYREVVI